jgi:hypothetical protein
VLTSIAVGTALGEILLLFVAFVLDDGIRPLVNAVGTAHIPRPQGVLVIYEPAAESNAWQPYCLAWLEQWTNLRLALATDSAEHYVLAGNRINHNPTACHRGAGCRVAGVRMISTVHADR